MALNWNLFGKRIGAVSGIRTRVMSLEGSSANHYTMTASFLLELIVYLKLSLLSTTMLKN